MGEPLSTLKLKPGLVAGLWPTVGLEGPSEGVLALGVSWRAVPGRWLLEIAERGITNER